MLCDCILHGLMGSVSVLFIQLEHGVSMMLKSSTFMHVNTRFCRFLVHFLNRYRTIPHYLHILIAIVAARFLLNTNDFSIILQALASASAPIFDKPLDNFAYL